MFHLMMHPWGMSADPDDRRNRMHLVALDEARVATDRRDAASLDAELAAELRAARFMPRGRSVSSDSAVTLGLARTA